MTAPDPLPSIYIDTSALGRVLLGEPDSDEILRTLASYRQRIANRLTRLELTRLGRRTGKLIEVGELLEGVALVPLTQAHLDAAESVTPAAVATLDSIHLVTAIALRDAGLISAMLTYDQTLATAVRANGLDVVAP